MISETKWNERIVMTADMNTHVGRERNGWESLRGCHGYGKQGVKGKRVLETAQAFGLCLVNIIFKKMDQHLVPLSNVRRKSVYNSKKERSTKWVIVKPS